MLEALEPKFGSALIQWMNLLVTQSPSSLAALACRHWTAHIKPYQKIPLWKIASVGWVGQDWAAHKLAMFERDLHWQVWKSCACADPAEDSQFAWPLIMDWVLDSAWIDFQEELKLRRAVEEFELEQVQEQRVKLVAEINEAMKRAVEKMCKKSGDRIRLNKSLVFADVVKILFGQD
eukprot:TRINITY_DN10403_c0_g2_i2.p1 TRINITY_DN10403_c0_g2~~TRINITY_DN10403_c0_g2_i2.p1  ORF type:complete len:177 (-),score=25.55 TRINITY_DN10403_c0_g2_i2:74-604(-)